MWFYISLLTLKLLWGCHLVEAGHGLPSWVVQRCCSKKAEGDEKGHRHGADQEEADWEVELVLASPPAE